MYSTTVWYYNTVVSCHNIYFYPILFQAYFNMYIQEVRSLKKNIKTIDDKRAALHDDFQVKYDAKMSEALQQLRRDNEENSKKLKSEVEELYRNQVISKSAIFTLQQ